MEVRLSKLVRRMLADPKACQQIREMTWGQRNTIEFGGQVYRVEYGPQVLIVNK